MQKIEICRPSSVCKPIFGQDRQFRGRQPGDAERKPYVTGLLAVLGCGVAGGLLFHVLHIPGGAMIGAVLAVVGVRLIGHLDAMVPGWFQLAANIGIGIVVGNMMTSQTLVEIKSLGTLMVLTTGLLLVAALIGTWFVWRWTGMDIPSAILATSPGGLSAVVGLAADMGQSAPAVMAFQVVRMYTVVLLAPILSKVLYWILH